MRFSDLALWRRIVAVVITLAICILIYWVVKALADSLPLPIVLVLDAILLTLGLWLTLRDSKAERLARSKKITNLHRELNRRE